VSVCHDLDIRLTLNDPEKLLFYYVYSIDVYHHEAWATTSTDVTTIVNWITKKFTLANRVNREIHLDGTVEYYFGVKLNKSSTKGYLVTIYKTDSGIVVLATYVNNPWWR
jgi:hypothetical protein